MQISLCRSLNLVWTLWLKAQSSYQCSHRKPIAARTSMEARPDAVSCRYERPVAPVTTERPPSSGDPRGASHLVTARRATMFCAPKSGRVLVCLHTPHNGEWFWAYRGGNGREGAGDRAPLDASARQSSNARGRAALGCGACGVWRASVRCPACRCHARARGNKPPDAEY
jgi:hypothetical protein